MTTKLFSLKKDFYVKISLYIGLFDKFSHFLQNTMTYTLDRLDKALLNLLQSDATIPLKDLAEQVHASVATCQRRIKHLRDSGVIHRQVALVNPAAVGHGLSVFVLVEMLTQNTVQQHHFERLMSREDAVTSCYEVSGDFGFLVLIHARDMADYHDFTRRVFTSDNNVRNFKSQFVMNFSKAETKITLR